MNIKKLWHFLKLWNQKTNDGVLLISLCLVLLILSIGLYNFMDWKQSVDMFLKGFISLVGSITIIAVVYICWNIIMGLNHWIFKDLVPKFKETCHEFNYVPEDKAKVKFE